MIDDLMQQLCEDTDQKNDPVINMPSSTQIHEDLNQEGIITRWYYLIIP
jgi:hypothetical protein